MYRYFIPLLVLFFNITAFAQCYIESGNALYFPGAAAVKSNVVMQSPLAMQASNAIFKGLPRSQNAFSVPIFGLKDIVNMTRCPPVLYSGNLVHAAIIYKNKLTVVAQAKTDNEGALALPPGSTITSIDSISKGNLVFAVPYSTTEGMVAGYLVKTNKIGPQGARLLETADQSRALQAITPTGEDSGRFQYQNSFFIATGQSHVVDSMIVVARKQAIMNHNKLLVTQGKEKYQLKILELPTEFTSPGPSIYVSSDLPQTWASTIAKNVLVEGFTAQHPILDTKDGYVPTKSTFNEQLKKLQGYLPLLETVRGK
jgi:hypothetical protein